MSSLPAQPLQVSDFSGGLTENFIGGGATRYMSADNFWVTVDRKLEERFGSLIYDSTNYQLPSGNSPVNALIPHDNEAFLLGVACPNLYVLNPNWTSILGPTGNPPLAGGTYMSQISWGEWSHHTIIANDSLNSKPVKIFRGAPYPTTLSSAPTSYGFMAVTAGLPSLVGSQNTNNAILLQNCILLANDLRTQMLAHMNDVGSIGTNLHLATDTAEIATITAAPLCYDLPSLLTLVTALIAGYGPHVADVINAVVNAPTYHFAVAGGGLHPLNYLLVSTTTPTTLAQAATLLDDLKTKFFMHEMAVQTHDNYTNYSVIGVHLVNTPHIGTITTGPYLQPNYTQSLALANNLKASLNAHFADTTYHIIADTNDAIGFPDAVDLDSLYIMIAHCVWQYERHYTDSAQAHTLATTNTTNGSQSLSNIEYAVTTGTFTPANGQTIWDASGTVFAKASQIVTVTNSGWAGPGTAKSSINALTMNTNFPLDYTNALYHVGQNTDSLNETFTAYPGYPTDASQLTNWLYVLTTCVAAYNYHDSNSAVHLTSSLHPTTKPTPTIASYAYAFHWFYQYARYDGVIFNVVGPVLQVGPVQSEAITPSLQTVNPTGGAGIVSAAVPLVISNLPVLQNGGQDNYDVTNVQLKIFRTINAGSTYLYAGIVTNGTTTYTDTLPDTLTSNGIIPLINQAPIYTSGGVVNFDPAPVCKFVTVLQTTAYYGAVVDTGQTFLNRIRQSIPNNIDSSPGSFFYDLPDVLMGMSSTRNNLIAFCLNSCHLMAGAFTNQGQGQMSAQSISDTIGCVSGESIVRTDVGIFFAGTDGFYYTDGFQLIKLSSELNLTYQALVSNAKQKASIYGCYDRYNRRVWWSTQPDPTDTGPTQSWVFHVNYGVTAQGVFTTASNGESYRPSSMIFWQGKQIRGDSRGYIFLHSVLAKTDPQVNVKTAATSWNTLAIPYNYASCALDFGTTFNRKWLTRISFQAKNVGNVAAQIQSVSDAGRVPPLNLPPMYAKPNIQWGQPNLIWGAPNSQQPIVWGNTQQMDMWRRFPATQLRADYKQIVVQPAFVGVYRYQDWPQGAGAQLLPQGGGVCWAQMLTPSGYTTLSWPLDVVGYVFATSLDGFVATYTITGLTTTVVANDTLILSDPTNTLTAIAVSWVIRGLLKQQRLSMTSYAIHFTLLGKMQQAYHGAQDSGENTQGDPFPGGVLISEGGVDITTEDGQHIDQ